MKRRLNGERSQVSRAYGFNRKFEIAYDKVLRNGKMSTIYYSTGSLITLVVVVGMK